jgi:hypothetical protein
VQQDGYHVASPFRNSYLISFLLDLTATIQEDTGCIKEKQIAGCEKKTPTMRANLSLELKSKLPRSRLRSTSLYRARLFYGSMGFAFQ